jgi:hypothetical protein
MTGFGRTLSILVGAATAGVLVWTAAHMNTPLTTGGYWAALGILSVAGLALALVELISSGRWVRPQLRASTLVLGLGPSLIAAGWVMIAGQPHAGWLRNHIAAWSSEIGIGGPVDALSPYAPVLAFGLGLLLGFGLESSRPRPVSFNVTRLETPVAGKRGDSNAEQEPSTSELRRAA